MLKRVLAGVIVAGMLAGPAESGPFEDGDAAYRQGDYNEAVKKYRLAAAQGNAKAQYNLGAVYAFGLGVPQDYAEAVKWYRLAADQGNAGAQHNLGLMYTGLGVPQDDVFAHMWFNLAAAQGNSGAVEWREITASRMPPEQLAEAQRLAREWKPAR